MRDRIGFDGFIRQPLVHHNENVGRNVTVLKRSAILMRAAVVLAWGALAMGVPVAGMMILLHNV